jgi:hypothetical protein
VPGDSMPRVPELPHEQRSNRRAGGEMNEHDEWNADSHGKVQSDEFSSSLQLTQIAGRSGVRARYSVRPRRCQSSSRPARHAARDAVGLSLGVLLSPRCSRACSRRCAVAWSRSYGRPRSILYGTPPCYVRRPRMLFDLLPLISDHDRGDQLHGPNLRALCTRVFPPASFLDDGCAGADRVCNVKRGFRRAWNVLSRPRTMSSSVLRWRADLDFRPALRAYRLRRALCASERWPGRSPPWLTTCAA